MQLNQRGNMDAFVTKVPRAAAVPSPSAYKARVDDCTVRKRSMINAWPVWSPFHELHPMYDNPGQRQSDYARAGTLYRLVNRKLTAAEAKTGFDGSWHNQIWSASHNRIYLSCSSGSIRRSVEIRGPTPNTHYIFGAGARNPKLELGNPLFCT